MNSNRVLLPVRSAIVAVLVGVAGAWAPIHQAAASAMLACSHPSNLCVDSGGAAWTPNGRSTPTDEANRDRKSPGQINLAIDNGRRGSLFVNGRYTGTAPLSGAQVPSGKNDIQVRDGTQVLAMGTLDVPRGATVSLSVRHP